MVIFRQIDLAILFKRRLSPSLVTHFQGAPPEEVGITKLAAPSMMGIAPVHASSAVSTSASSATVKPMAAGITRPILQAQIPGSLRTPLRLDAFQFYLQSHPDSSFVSRICDILTRGANIGFVGPECSRYTPNAASARTHAAVLLKSVMKEVSCGHAVGPFYSAPFPNFVVSSLGVRVKKSGGYRIILDLSQPFGGSVNDFIDKKCYSMKYSMK